MHRSPPGKAAAPAPTTEAMEAEGASIRHVQNKSNQLRIGNLFLKHVQSADKELSAAWGLEFMKVPEKHAASKEIYAHLATFVTHTYTIDFGNVNSGRWEKRME